MRKLASCGSQPASRTGSHFHKRTGAKGTSALPWAFPVINTRSKEDNLMNTFDDQDEFIIDERRNTQRDIIRQSLDAIANDIGDGNA